ncbi:MAG: glycoside hydrolase family 88 protein [Clostridia bacterium]|nr:glycoside hydrolase family 88 protein [Clostridia bacterium]
MSFTDLIEKHKSWIERTFEKLDEKLSHCAVRSREKIPYTVKDGVHDDRKNNITWWTNGFWGGLMWLMYEATRNPEYEVTARVSEGLLEKAFEEIDGLHHDVGFMFHLTSGASYRLTGDKRSRRNNLLAAMLLASRYNSKGEFIRAWNIENSEGWTIIDSMMNIPLLYWASREVGDDRFKYIAVAQADMCARDHVREDGTIHHIVMHDTTKPKVLGTRGGQGYKEGSCWSRGQSWAVYGFILSYIHTQDKKYLEVARRVADLFIEETKKTEWLPRIDFKQPETPLKYDSTAGAIAACGMIEIAKCLEGAEAEKYLAAAICILQAMEKNWCDFSDENDSILQMGSEQYKGGVHIPIIYGDFFFTEAILKLKGSNFLIW